MIINTLLINLDKYYFTDLDNVSNIILSKNNQYILGYKNNIELKLKEINEIENTDLYFLFLEQDQNNIFLKVKLFIDKLEYLINNGQNIPDRKNIFNILDKYYDNYNLQNKQNIKIKNLINNDLTQYNKIKINYNIAIYDYQKKIIKWMMFLEKKINIKYYYYTSKIIKLKNTYIDINKGKTFLDYDKNFFNISGGILIDEYYYGKATAAIILCGISGIQTLDSLDKNKIKSIQIYDDIDDSISENDNPLSMKEYYIYNKRKLVSNSVLIICPHILVNQWKSEINNTYDNIKIICITNKKELNQFTYEDLIISDFVIVSIKLLDNKFFKKIWKDYKLNDEYSLTDCIDSMGIEYMRNKDILKLKNPFISLIYWKRIIIDEFTELLNEQTYYLELVKSLDSVYKWYLNNKIPNNSNKLFNLLNTIFNIPNTLFIYNNNNNLINPLDFIKQITVINKKENVLKEIQLPNIKEEVKILEYSDLEKILYKSYLHMYNKDNILDDDDDDIDYIYTYIYNQIINDIYITLMNCKSLDEVRYKILNINKKNLIKYNNIKNKLEEKKLEYKNILLLKKDNLEIINKNIQELSVNVKEICKKIQDTNNHINYYNNISDNNIKYKLDNSLNKCCICLEKIKDSDFGITICGHIFCFMCIIESVNYNKKCPYCRSELEKKDIFKIINKRKFNKIKKKIIKTDIDVNYVGTKAINIVDKKNKVKSKEISKSLGAYPNNYINDDNTEIFNNNKDIKYLNNYNCNDLSLLVELYGSKIAHLIKFLINIINFNNNEKIIIYTKLSDNLIININNILCQYKLKVLSYLGTKNQKNKIIDKFNKGNYNIVLMSIKDISFCVNLQGINKIIYLEPLFGDKNHINNIEKQGLGLAYYLNQISDITIIRFIIKDSIEEKIYNQMNN